MKKKSERTEFHVGSGNVFKDLGFENAEEALAKARLAMQIHKAIKSQKLTQKEAAEILDIDQPRVSDIIRGNLGRYSLDKLMRFVRMLGNGIEIRIKSKKSHPKLEVRAEKATPRGGKVTKPKVRRRKKVRTA